MGDDLLQSYEAYVRRTRKFLFLGGVLPSASIHPIQSYCSAFITASTCFGMSCGVLYFCWSNIKNLNILTKGMSFVCSLIATSLRATCFVTKRKKLIELHETLEELFRQELKENPRTRSTLLSLLHTFDRPAYVFSFLVGATLSMYLLPPLILLFRQLVHHTETKVYSLPFPAKFPWIVEDGGFLYQIHFVYEVVVAWFLLFTNSGVDALFGFYVFQMASLLRAMTYKIRNPLPGEDSAELLRSCIEKHGKLLRCRDILQDVYGPIIFWLVLTNGVVMCALIFQAVQSNQMTLGKVVMFTVYMFLKIVQTFSYAWYGGIVTAESEEFRQGIYFCDWTGENNRSLRAILVVSMLQRPITVTALKLFFVSVDMFTKIMNTTMSYFFLLQTLDESG